MTDIKTIFSTEVKQPKLGVLHWVSKVLGDQHNGRKIDYLAAVNAAAEANKTLRTIHYWVEPVFEEH